MAPRRTLEEVLLISEVESSLVDVFCEGLSDVQVLTFFVSAISGIRASVYSADQIEWPEDLSTFGGHRGKIVHLSQMLSSRGVNGICVVDRDLESIEPATDLNPNLLMTDYSCLNMCGLDEGDVREFIYSKYNVALSAAQLLSVFEACKHLFVARFLRDRFCAGASLPTAEKILVDPVSCEVSVGVFLDRCKQLNGYDVRWDKVSSNHEGVFKSLSGSFRDYINIHDLDRMLSTVVRSHKSKSTNIPTDFVGKHCIYVLIAQRMFGFPLFEQLSTRLVQ